jgi:MFS family permease
MSCFVLPNLNNDARVLFATRFIRLFAYGSLSVVLVFYLVSIGLTESQVGLLLGLTLAGDTFISLSLTTRADRFGRRRTLIIGAALMAIAGLIFASAHTFGLLLLGGTVGVISPSGNEVGPFLSIEQAALSHLVTDRARTRVFAWYTLIGSVATALGALLAGLLTHAFSTTAAPARGFQVVIVLYAVLGLTLTVLFARLSLAAEASGQSDESASRGVLARLSGLERSRGVIAKLSTLFALDAFGGGFVIQSFAAYWFYLRFGTKPEALGVIFFWANVLAGVSALLASRLAGRIGLVNTMVVTHLPSNVLLVLVPLMPNQPLAIAVLLIRFSISQMDVPARQSYVMAIVAPEERSAAAGIAGVARSIGAALSPVFVGYLFAQPALINVPFFVAGTLKIAYDLLLYRGFKALRPPEETPIT